jgi:hypothetical protein
MTIRRTAICRQSGVGNLGTHSAIDLARVAADVLAMPGKDRQLGNTSKNLPWSCMSVGARPRTR